MELDDVHLEWLNAQPLDEPVKIDDESVYLNMRSGGAELGAFLFRTYTQDQLRHALKCAFRSALHYEAGLGKSSDGTALVLTQWVPGASGWTDAAEALEDLLNALELFRETLGHGKVQEMGNDASRNEQRLRSMLSGGKR